MSKVVLISIQPKRCELIASGKKTIEVRKTRPSIETPFKCYIYCTKSNQMLWVTDERHRYIGIACLTNAKAVGGANKANGKVIGEFVCDEIYPVKPTFRGYMVNDDIALTNRIGTASCLDLDDMRAYLGNKNGYAWHISNLVIYDKPRELGEFRPYCKFAERIDEEAFECVSGRRYGCKFKRFDLNPDGSVNLYTCDTKRKITRPPQSWCYVEV